jgi:hypothetical protein
LSSFYLAQWGEANFAATLIVIAGRDPAIHAEDQHENLLGLHLSEPAAGNSLRRHDE